MYEIDEIEEFQMRQTPLMGWNVLASGSTYCTALIVTGAKLDWLILKAAQTKDTWVRGDEIHSYI